ncbi:MAG TPA: RagB/SusD family nutrient uptake outer membrane protein [Bacteroidales bacterium]|nr:RagB/SusD family nutrient uptake outer membrane protein [Bacteroidales bacterium]
MKKLLFLNIFILLFFLAGCEKEYLERVPTSSLAEKDLLSTVGGNHTLLHGIHRSTYAFYGTHGRYGQRAVDLVIDLLGEDLYQSERGYGWFVSWYQYIEHRNINSGDLEWVWSYYYDIVDNANIILANIDNASDAALNPARVQFIKANALTYRAFSFYQLVQLYALRYDIGGTNSHQGIPVYTEPTQEGKARSTVAEVYTRINADLDEAISLFTASNYSRVNVSEINIRVAQGLKARVALTTGQYSTAETMAKTARTGHSLVPATKYGYGWNKADNSEWMWGAILITEQQTSYASCFSHIDPYFGGYATLGNHKLMSTVVYDYMSATDERKKVFKTIAGKPRVGKKFTGNGGYEATGQSNWTNDYLYMRAAEMFVIEAEAIARQGGRDDEAQTVLFNLVSQRDPSYVKSVLTGNDLIQDILMQRRCELWGEGSRFFDLKRLNLDLNRENLGHTTSLWNAAGYFPAGDKNFVFLIPKQEIDANPQMIQNEL